MPLSWVARKLEITRGAVAQWDRVPAERIGAVSRITGIPPQILRPDLFPDEETAA
jgi:DNA-binding transcriptional regulator YdaS (Cro superfamily)